MFELNNNGYKRRILIIDDDVELAETIREVLELEGFIVDSVSEGHEGLMMQNSKPYNLIVTDILMPDMDGLEVIMKVRSQANSTKILAISGGGYGDSRDYLIMAKQLGASMVLCKPFDMINLVASVKRILLGSSLS